MRVLHVITRLIVGGAQENTISTVLGLLQKPGVEVGLISGPSSGPEGSLERAFGGSAGVLRILPDLVRPIHPWKDVAAWRRLTRIFRKERPDLVHTHSGKAGVVGRLAARRAGVPVIVHTIHGPSFGPFQGPVSNWVFRAAERAAGRATTHFVVVADAMRCQYQRAGIGRPGQFTRIWSGFDLQPYLTTTNDLSVRASLGLRPEDVVIGKVARLFRLKGHEDILAISPELIRENPNLKVLFVGGGEWEGRFRRQVAALGLTEHFVFTGLVAPERVPVLIGVMDMLVHTSRREGLARALPQALAAGKPVIAYDCDGAGEVCLHERTGLLVSPGDLGGLSDAIRRLIGDPVTRRRYGEAGRDLVRQQFTVEKMVDDTYALYCRLLKGHHRV